jgi:ElaA protein
MKWSCKAFKELSLDEFHDIIQLREIVFVVEQDCPYLDVDGKDKEALHVFGEYEGNIVATTRILKPGKSYDEVAIGRVVTSPTVRGMGMGKQLMEESMKFVKLHFGKVPVRISAQTYLLRYYKSFGFIETGEEYLEDNIPHFEMLYKP